MNIFKALVVVLFLYPKLNAEIKTPDVHTGTDEKSEEKQKRFLSNKDFLDNARNTFVQLKDVSGVVSNPDKLEKAAAILNKIADQADKLLESDLPQDEKQRLAVYKALGRQTRNLVQHLRTSVDETTISTIPAAAKILHLANQIGGVLDEKNTFHEIDVRIGKFIETIDKITGSNLSVLADNLGVEKLKPWKPSLLDLEYLFWFEQCILPLTPTPITINIESGRIEYERDTLINDFKKIIEHSKFQSSQELLIDLQNKIKALRIYNKNSDGPFSNIVFNGGKLSDINVNGLLKSLNQEERQALESKEKADKEAAEGPAIDATWYFSKETWLAILTIMQLSATVINVSQYIQQESHRAREVYEKYAQVKQEEAAKLVQNAEKALQNSTLSSEQQADITSEVKMFLESPDTTSARHLIHSQLAGGKRRIF